MGNVAVMFERADFEFVRMTNQSVKQEVLTAALIGRTNEISECRNRHKIRAHNVFLSLFNCGNFGKVSYNAVCAGLDNNAFAFAVDFGFGINHSNIRAALFMEVQNFLEVDIVNVTCIRQKDVLSAAQFGEVEVSINIFKVAFTRIVIGQSRW